MGQIETTLNEFIRRLGLNDDRLGQLERRMTAADEGVRNLWTDGLRGSNACITTFEGQIQSPVDSTPIPFATLRVLRFPSLLPLGTFTADAGGNYSAAVQVPSDEGVVLLYNTGPGVRFQESTVGSSSIGARCGTQPVNPLYAIPANGYHYASDSVYPLADTMKLQDSYYGNRDIPWFAQYEWRVVPSVTIPASGSCAAVASSLLYRFIGIGGNPMQFSILSPRNTGTGCPGVGFPQGGFPMPSPPTGTFQGVSTKLDLTWNVGAGTPLSNFLYGGGAATVRLYEP